MKQLRGKPLRDFLRRTRRPDVELAFLLQDIEDPVNVGFAFRIADACGVAEIILTGISARPPHPLIAKVGRGRDRRVSWRYVENRGRGYRPPTGRRVGKSARSRSPPSRNPTAKPGTATACCWSPGTRTTGSPTAPCPPATAPSTSRCTARVPLSTSAFRWRSPPPTSCTVAPEGPARWSPATCPVVAGVGILCR